MIDLSSVVWESTRKKAGEWASQPCVREGLLTLFDAACMMSSEGYGGIFDTCSKYTQADINGYFEALKSEIHKQGGVLEGYPPVQRYVNGREQVVFPVAAFLAYCNRTGTGDERYFSRRVDELGGKDAGCGIQKERPTESRPTESRPTAARGMSSPDVVPFEWCDSDLFPSLIAEDVPDEPDASVLEEVEVYSIQDAVVWMLGLDWDYLCIDRWNGEETYIFQDEVELNLKQALLDSVVVGEYRLSLAGYEFRNPFNAYDAEKAKFPREAYYQWWKDCDHGLPCPAWFEDLRKSDEAAEADKTSVEGSPAPDEGADDDHELRLGYDAVRMDDDLSDAIDFGRCTRKVLTVIAEYLRRPEERQTFNGDPERRAEYLMKAIEAAARKEKWGTNRGELSDEQWQAIRALMLPASTGKGCVAAMWGGRTQRDKKRRN